tara:strand:- start:1438 stop:1911 length:474 start_codon:yes stop_codon:yes gene_type:complete
MNPLQAYLNSPRAQKALATKPGEEGFSLIELVVVVAVLAVLAAIAIPNFTDVSNKARASAASSTLASIVKSCAAQVADSGSGTYIAPSLNGYTWAESAGGSAVTGTRNCHGSTGVYEATSNTETEYATWRYDVSNGSKTCVGSGNALSRGCDSNGNW